MKKRIVIGLSIFSVLFFLSGVYIIATIQRATVTLDKLVVLHQVEILREHLLIQVKRVQSDLILKNTRYAKGVDELVKDVGNMVQVARACHDCHHAKDVMVRLDELNSNIEGYKNALSRVSTIRANTERLAAEEDAAHRLGENLISTINSMIAFTSGRLEVKTQATLREISRTKTMIFVLLAIGPVVAVGLGYYFVTGITRPIGKLVSATRRLKSGDLDHRVEGLEEEFGELGSSFNEMAKSLKDHMHAIAVSEKRYRTLFESAGDAVFILEAEGPDAGRIVAANRAAAEMHGYTVEELLSMSIRDLDDPESAKKAPDRFRRILDGEWIKCEVRHFRKDGTLFPIDVSAGLLEYDERRYVIAFDRDISERKRTEEALQRAEQMKMVGELAAGLAHEIKNPLAGIKASMELLSETSGIPEKDTILLIKSIEDVIRIESLLRDLISFAKPPKPQLISVNVNQVIATTVTFLKNHPAFSTRNGKGIVVLTSMDENIPDSIADPLHLRQAILNLMLNAAEAMPQGGAISLETMYDRPARTIRIRVRDTGKGIDKNHAERIFHPFFTTKPRGTGLGLAITKQLIEQLGGRIGFESSECGTTFMIDLPAENGGDRWKG